jgi:hypothetical protein
VQACMYLQLHIWDNHTYQIISFLSASNACVWNEYNQTRPDSRPDDKRVPG